MADLVCPSTPPLLLAITIGQIAGTHPHSLPEPHALRRVQLFFAAAVHSATVLNPPPGLAPTEWLLLAALEGFAVTADHGPQAGGTAEACAVLLHQLCPLPRHLLAVDSPLLCYGCDHLLPIACDASALTADRIAQAGRALGSLARLAHEALALWCPPAAHGGFTQPHLLTRIALEDPALDRPIRIAWAKASLPAADLAPLRRIAGQPGVVRSIEARVSAWSDACMAAPIAPAKLECMRALSDTCTEQLDRALGAARFWALSSKASDPGCGSELGRAIDMARAALSDEPSLHEAWEVQRWGDWCKVARIGRLFPVGLCLLARAAAGENISEAASTLLQSRRADGYRHYDDWTGIAPDADVLGLVLQLLPFCAGDEQLRQSLAWPVELLFRNTQPNGLIPTWLEDGLKEPPPAGSPHWLGRECLGVVANALIGLLQARWPLPEGFLERALGFVITAWETEQASKSFFYAPPYVHLLLARLCGCVQEVHPGFGLGSRLDAIVSEIEKDVLLTQQADGGWVDVLATASHLALLGLRRPKAADPRPPALWLAGRQQPDGLWPAEPFYRCPGKDGAPENYASRAVTAAVCIQALTRARAWIGTTG